MRPTLLPAPLAFLLLACGPPGPTPRPGDAPPSPWRVSVLSFLGGEAKESVRDAAFDGEGNVVFTGGTETEGFRTTEGAFDGSHNGWQDVWVAKVGPAGELLWSTLLGGPGYDRAYGVEVRDDGTVVVAGRAGEGFPSTEGSLQAEFGGDVNPSGSYGGQDGFVAALSADGSELLWATFFGVDDGSNIRDLDVDAEGAVYLAADAAAEHPSVHVTEGAHRTEIRGDGRDALVAKLSPDGSRLVWGTYVGGTGHDGGAGSVRVDRADGSVWLLAHTRSEDLEVTDGAWQASYAGEKDVFLARIAPDGSEVLALTYFGGSAEEFSETHGLSLGPDGTPYVTASTFSDDLPGGSGSRTPGFQTEFAGAGHDRETGLRTNYPGDGFVARFSADARELLGFTYFGGRLGEGIEGSAVDGAGRVWVAGATYSEDLPVPDTALRPEFAGVSDAFVACFTPDLSELVWATHLGGSSYDFLRCMAAAPDGAVAAGGITYSADLPVTEGAPGRSYGADSDALLVRYDPAPEEADEAESGADGR